MNIKLNLFIIFISITVSTSVNALKIDSLINPPIYPTSFSYEDYDYITAKPYISYDQELKLIDDYKHRVSKNFVTIDKYFYNNTEFWFKVYTQFNSNQVIIHDKNNMSIIYDILDFTRLPFMNKTSNSILQTSLVTKYLSIIKTDILKYPNCEIRYICKVIKSKFKRPTEKQLISLSNNIRSQTGQRNFIRSGVKNSLKYSQFLKRYFKIFKAPLELINIAFLESSFNTKARSSAGAIGIWQFMPYISKRILGKKRYIKYARNPYISSIGALHLLKQNYMILKRWDLAITAYNSGTNAIIKMRRKLKVKKKDLSLPLIFEHTQNNYHGFASKNYYSEFLALTRVMNYLDEIFPVLLHKKKTHRSIKFYVSNCRFKLNRILKNVKNKKKFLKHNSHLTSRRHTYPKGTILVSDLNLNKKKYRKLSNSMIRNKFPKNWNRYKRKTCN